MGDSMPNNASAASYPWNKYANKAEILYVEGSNIGNYCFAGFSKLEIVEMYEVKSIGSNAFRNCSALSAVYFIICGFIFDGRITLVSDIRLWGLIAGLGLWSTMVSNFTGVKAVRRIGPTMTSILGALQPLTAVVLGVLFLDEHLGVRTIAGISIIMVTVTFIVAHQQTRKHHH
jgi:drug/metabolite transporter (DMT)-like permease